MRDLYQKLGIGRNASAEEVAAALELKPELSAFAPILLNRKKRAVYDRTHAALSAIGVLRHHLGLEDGGSEFAKNYPDFAFRPRPRATGAGSSQAGSEPPVAAEKQEARPSPASPAKTDAGRGWPLPFLAVLAVAILLVLLSLYF